MKTEDRIKKQRELVEQIGTHLDKEGFQPIAGRILGLLMVMDKEQYTFDEIVEELQISKSSASNALRNLEIREMVEYSTQPGDRKRYFHVRRQNMNSLVEDIERNISFTSKMLKTIIELKADPNSENARYFKQVSEMMDLIMKDFAKVKQRFMK